MTQWCEQRRGDSDPSYKERSQRSLRKLPQTTRSSTSLKMAASTIFTLAVFAVMLVAVSADTACQRARVSDQKSSNPYVIHECDAQGNYEAKQKTVGTPHWYWCYAPDGGIMQGPSRKIQTCACAMEQYRIRTNNAAQKKNEAEPVCENTGHFKKEQTDQSHKWCVNPNTGAVTKSKIPKAQVISC